MRSHYWLHPRHSLSISIFHYRQHTRTHLYSRWKKSSAQTIACVLEPKGYCVSGYFNQTTIFFPIGFYGWCACMRSHLLELCAAHVNGRWYGAFIIGIADLCDVNVLAIGFRTIVAYAGEIFNIVHCCCCCTYTGIRKCVVVVVFNRNNTISWWFLVGWNRLWTTMFISILNRFDMNVDAVDFRNAAASNFLYEKCLTLCGLSSDL